MNAVAATNIQPEILASFAAQPATGASAPAAAFTSLINLLLAPEFESEDAAQSESIAQQAAAPQISDAQLADAMIRSMLGSGGPPRKTVAPAPAQAPKSQSADFTQIAPQIIATVPGAIGALIGSPQFRSADTNQPAKNGSVNLKLPAGATLTQPAPAAAPKAAPATAPLAFSLRLTPLADAEAALPASNAAAVPAAVSAVNKDATPVPATAPAPTETQPDPEPAPESKPGDSKPQTQIAETKSKTGLGTPDGPAPIVVAAVAAASEGGDAARSLPNPGAMPTAISATSKEESAPAPSAMEALRASEPIAASGPTHAAAPVHEIAVRIAQPQAPAVDVHLTERAGQVHVAVRTADGGLQTSLRQDLGSLVSSLERSGYRAEAFTPREGIQAAGVAAQTNSQNSRQESEPGSGGRGNSGDASQNSGSGQQQQRQRDSRPHKWIEELENQQ